MPQLEAVVLDVNETLFSLDAVGEAFQAIGLQRGRLDLWFARVLRDGLAVAAMGGAVAFPDLARHNVRVLGDRAGVAVGDDDVESVVAAFDAVEAHPDVADGLRRLSEDGLRLVAYTNGSAPIVARFLERAGLDDVVEEALDVTAAGRWKPHPDAYGWVCDHLGVRPAGAAMLAVHPWDVAGGMRAGMFGAWVNRSRKRWPSWFEPADRSATSMVELADGLVRR